MKRRLWHRARTFAAALLLMVASLAMAGPARAAWPVNGDCDTLDNGHSFFGNYAPHSPTNHPTSIKASLYGDPARFQPCTNPGFLDFPNDTQWISIEVPGTSWDIIQVGMEMCTKADTGNCYDANGVDHVNQLGYFWAYGRLANQCDGYTDSHAPYGIWLGAVPLVGVPPGPGYHTFQITDSRTQPTTYIYIDGVQVASILTQKICWIENPNTGTHIPDFAAERHDPNDGFGGPGPVWFKDMQWADDWGSLVNTNLSSCGSVSLQAEFQCTYSSTTKFGLSTVNQ